MDKKNDIAVGEVVNLIHKFFTTRKDVIGDGWDINRIATDDYVLYQDCMYLEGRLKDIFNKYINHTLDWDEEYDYEEKEFYGDDEDDDEDEE